MAERYTSAGARERLARESAPYVHQDWPAWFYGPDGAKGVFNSQDEGPSGWASHPDLIGKKAELKDAALQVADDDDDVTNLMKKTASELTTILTSAQAIDPTVEFLPSWPKLRLAKTIVAHGIDWDENAAEDDEEAE
jgi:hypothetical protein